MRRRGASAPIVEWATRRGAGVTGPWLEGPRGPSDLQAAVRPAGRDRLNRGEIRWTAANGNGPRDHPAIKHLNLPPLGQGGRVSPLVTKTMVFLGEGGNNAVVALPPGGGGKMFRAYDKATGQRDLGDGAARRHHRRADDLHVRRQAVHRRRDWLEGHGGRARRAGAALIGGAEAPPYNVGRRTDVTSRSSRFSCRRADRTLNGQGQQPAANQPPPPSRALPQVTQEFISVDAPVVALQHVRVIDGTGAPAASDQTIVIEGGLIKAIGPSALDAGAGRRTRARSRGPHGDARLGRRCTSICSTPARQAWAAFPACPSTTRRWVFSFPRLYLAAGVTTIRTAGSMEPYADLEVKRYIDAGRIPGPKMHLTGPYLQGAGAYLLQLHSARPARKRRRKHGELLGRLGFTSFKAYTNITRAQLGAAIRAAHARGLKVTGHLCSVTFREAADLGIDSLEHGHQREHRLRAGQAAGQVPGARPARTAIRRSTRRRFRT